jgi:hypothetical protein
MWSGKMNRPEGVAKRPSAQGTRGWPAGQSRPPAALSAS